MIPGRRPRFHLRDSGHRLEGEPGEELCREDDRGVLLDRDLGQRLRGAQLHRDGLRRQYGGRLRQLLRRYELPIRGDDLRPLLPLGLGFFGHGALEVLGERYVLQLDHGHDDAPGLGLQVDYVLDLLVDVLGRAEQLVQARLAHDVFHGRLRYLIYRLADVLDGDHRLDAVVGVVVGHSGYVDGHVVPGDDRLRRDRHRHGPQAHSHHAVRYRDQHMQPGLEHLLQLPEAEHHPALVLPDDLEYARAPGNHL